MNIRGMGCCAAHEITWLSSHRSASEAMMALRGALRSAYVPGVPGHILFTGVVAYTGDEGRDRPTYGQKFAAFITKHGLGEVTEGPEAPNRINHPGHIVKVWTWAPNPTRLNAYWNKRKEKK